ncbi:FAD-binding domain-containing protein [Panaeolus papilionaceus]|nr:FAD-binding domain-containing protein [Panaeolus papilionaceus]
MISHISVGLAIAGSFSIAVGANPTPPPTPPTAQDWNKLNNTVSGRLFPGRPFALPCFSSFQGQPHNVDQAACTFVQENFFNSHLNRSNAFGGYAATNFEMCMSTGASCELDYTNPTNPAAFAPPADCKMGSIADNYIDVQNQNDVIAALKFVKAHGVPLTIKNTGHDFQGRSSAPGSLALWMHHLKGMTLNPAFVAEGCPPATAPQVAVTVGAGQQFAEVYQFAHDNNVTIVGGSDQSVGMAGGWVQGGGHSSLSNAHGMGADRILQYKVITTDGVPRTVNACQNSDLFFALRGGGGGTFAIIMEATSMATPAESYRVANINWPASSANIRTVMSVFLQNATTFSLQGWGGYITPTIGNLILTTPKLNMADAQNSMKALVDVATSLGGVATITEITSFLDWFNSYVQGTSGTQDAVGVPNVLSSRLIPQSLHNTEADRQSLLDAMIFAFNQTSFSQLHFTTPYGFNGTDGKDTSVNPLWRTSLYQVIGVNSWFFNDTLADRNAAYAQNTAAITPLRNLTPNGGAYHNEADIHEPNFQQSFWGANYNKLLAIKNKYDPDHVLDCWHCVGWTASLPKYSCYI